MKYRATLQEYGNEITVRLEFKNNVFDNYNNMF